MFRWKATAAVIVVAALALTGCSGGAGEDKPTDSASGGGHADKLTLLVLGAPTSYDLGAGAEWGQRSPYFESVFDTILRQNSKGEVGPGLATKWEYNGDKTVLTLTLRKGVKFTDGNPVDAKAVVASMEHFRDGTSAQASTMKDNTYAATDDATVTITMSQPNPALVNMLTISQGLIASPASFASPDVATHPVGSGPYILDTNETVTGTKYVYHANPDYWDKKNLHYDNLTLNTMTDPTAVLNAIKSGEANGAKFVDNNAIPEIEGAGWKVEGIQLDFQGLLLLDRDGTMVKALGDKRVRQAINMALDRKALLQTLQSDHGTVTEQIFPTSSVAFDKSLDNTYKYDPKAAKKLLADAGYPDGFEMTANLNVPFQTAYDLIAQQLKDVGITMKTEDPGQGQFIKALLVPKYPVGFMGLQADHNDWQLASFLLAPTATFNPFHTQTDEVDGYLAQMRSGTPDEQTKAAKALNKYVVDEAWFAPLFRVQGSYAVDANTTLQYWPTNASPSIFGFAPKG